MGVEEMEPPSSPLCYIGPPSYAVSSLVGLWLGPCAWSPCWEPEAGRVGAQPLAMWSPTQLAGLGPGMSGWVCMVGGSAPLLPTPSFWCHKQRVAMSHCSWLQLSAWLGVEEGER